MSERDLAGLQRRLVRIGLTAVVVLTTVVVVHRARSRPDTSVGARFPAITIADGGRGRVIHFSLPAALAHRNPTLPALPERAVVKRLVLVRLGDLGAIARLYPVTHDSLMYESALPPLPEGAYQVFTEVAAAGGVTGLLVDSVRIGGGMQRWHPTNPADAMFAGGGVGTPFRFDDGTMLVWRGAANGRRAGEDAGFRFLLRDAAGRPLPTASTGNGAQAVLVRNDGGSYQQLDAMTYDAKTGELHVPYTVPVACRYRLWVQLPVRGRTRMAAFDVTVLERRHELPGRSEEHTSELQSH